MTRRQGARRGAGAEPQDAGVISTTENDRALSTPMPGAEGPPPAATAAPPAPPPSRAPRREEPPPEFDDDGEFGDEEDLDGFDDEPGMGDPRGGREDFSRSTRAMDVGAHGIGSRHVAHEVSALTRKMKALGPSVAVRFQRVAPVDLPESELGWTAWETLPQQSPTEEDLESMIQARFGGGAFEVSIRSATDRGLVIPELVRVRLHGQWKPTTHEGAEFWRARYGTEPPAMASRAPATDPGLGPTAEDARKLDVAGQLMGKAMEIADRSAERRAQDGVASKVGENALLVELVKSRGNDGGMGAVLAAMVTQQSNLQIAQIQAASERAKLDLERERMMREEARKDREMMLALTQRPAGSDASTTTAATLAAIEIVKATAQNEGSLKVELIREAMKTAMKLAGGSADEGDSWGDVFADLAKDGVRSLPSVVTAVASAMERRAAARGARGPGGPPQLPQGWVQGPDGIIYPPGRVPAHLLPQGSGAPHAAPPRRLPTPPPPHPTAADAVATAPTGEVPAGSPPAASPPVEPVPTTPAGDPLAGGGVPPEAVDGPAAGPPLPAGLDEAYVYQLDVLKAFHYYLGKADDLRPAWKGFWELTPGGVEHTIEDALDRSPRAFRDAMATVGKALDDNPATPVAFVAWVGDSPLEESKAIARAIEEALLQDPQGLAWVRAMLLDGPWDDEDDEDEEDDEGEGWKRGRRKK